MGETILQQLTGAVQSQQWISSGLDRLQKYLQTPLDLSDMSGPELMCRKAWWCPSSFRTFKL